MFRPKPIITDRSSTAAEYGEEVAVAASIFIHYFGRINK
jgi:hypothetical protein